MPLDDGDWDLAPLPTLLGCVDPRRFWAFHLGRAALANNGEYDAKRGSMDWPWRGPILHPPKSERADVAPAFAAIALT